MSNITILYLIFSSTIIFDVLRIGEESNVPTTHRYDVQLNLYFLPCLSVTSKRMMMIRPIGKRNTTVSCHVV